MSNDDSDPTVGEALSSRQIIRVDVNARKSDQLRAAVREMLSGYPYLGSLASSDSVAYHGVRTDAFRWLATDGVSVLLNDTTDGFFSDPGYVPVPEVGAATAARAGVTPGAPIQPNPHSNAQPMTPDQRVFGVAHEILHIAREDVLWKHVYEKQGFVPVPRSDAFPEGRAPFDNRSFELTCDAQINGALRADGVGKPPEGVYFNDSVEWGESFGSAYAKVYEKEQDGGGGRDPSRGPSKTNQGAGDLLAPGQAGDPFDPSTDPDDPATQPGDPGRAAEEIDAGRAEREVMHKRAQNMARQMGSGSCAVEDMVSRARAPSIDWRSYIFGFLSRVGGVSAWDWTRPARGPLLRPEGERYFSPSRGGKGIGHVVVAYDTSGSMGAAATRRALLGVVADMLATLRPKRFTLIFCDDRIQRVDDADPEADYAAYSIPMGGGTSFVPPFQWVKDNLDDEVDGFVYLTDLEGYAPAERPPYPVLWCCTTERTSPISGGRWGETVPVPPAELQP